ncbi:uncharacterized protein [Parasteatoda tepidariorum]|uniref:uncharacterized protein n=1 Tax=Parasteatoda tepidariorum TaxID=114398 RepID=UPI001C71D128|nr:uncharacterized protein LOC107448589 [Parasteatoda tepidariorum]
MSIHLFSKRCLKHKILYDTDKTDEFIRRFQLLRNFNTDNTQSDLSSDLEASILDFLRYYETNKTYIDICKSYPILMEDLPNICFQENIETGGTVREVFKTISALKPTALPQLILFILYQTCSYKTNSPEIIKQSQEEKRLVFCSSLAYFLHHASQLRITIDGKQLMEVIPEKLTQLYSKYIFFSEPRCVLILIQSGLRFRTDSALQPIHPIFQSVAKQLLWYIKTPTSEQEDPLTNMLLNCYFQGFLRFRRNLQILLKVTNNPQKVVFELPFIMATYFPGSSIEDIRNRLKYMFPELNLELKAPATLQHTCRWGIRESLLRNWNLPYGIWNLPLPRSIKKFINFSNE